MKLAGMTCILLGALWLRGARLRERRRTRETLADLCAALVDIAGDVHGARVPLPALLSRAAEESGPDAAAFFRAAACAGTGYGVTLSGGDASPAAAWRAAAKRLPLSARDRRTLAETASAFRGDEARVCAALLSAAERLSESVRALDAAAASEERLVTAVTLSAGAMLAILLY